MSSERFWSENWGIKALSLGLAVMLWFYVTSKGKTEITINVPVELRNIPQNMAVVGDVASSVEVRVQGQERVLRDITIGKKIFVVIDLSTTGAGENTVRISPDDIRRPPGVTVMHVSLPELKVRLEQLVRKSFRLQPVFRGIPLAGYQIAKVTVSPQRIPVEGPESVMKTIDRLPTMPIDIQNINASITVEPKIDYQGKPVKILAENIAVRISVERAVR